MPPRKRNRNNNNNNISPPAKKMIDYTALACGRDPPTSWSTVEDEVIHDLVLYNKGFEVNHSVIHKITLWDTLSVEVLASHKCPGIRSKIYECQFNGVEWDQHYPGRWLKSFSLFIPSFLIKDQRIFVRALKRRSDHNQRAKKKEVKKEEVEIDAWVSKGTSDEIDDTIVNLIRGNHTKVMEHLRSIERHLQKLEKALNTTHSEQTTQIQQLSRIVDGLRHQDINNSNDSE